MPSSLVRRSMMRGTQHRLASGNCRSVQRCNRSRTLAKVVRQQQHAEASQNSKLPRAEDIATYILSLSKSQEEVLKAHQKVEVVREQAAAVKELHTRALEELKAAKEQALTAASQAGEIGKAHRESLQEVIALGFSTPVPPEVLQALQAKAQALSQEFQQSMDAVRAAHEHVVECEAVVARTEELLEVATRRVSAASGIENEAMQVLVRSKQALEKVVQLYSNMGDSEGKTDADNGSEGIGNYADAAFEGKAVGSNGVSNGTKAEVDSISISVGAEVAVEGNGVSNWASAEVDSSSISVGAEASIESDGVSDGAEAEAGSSGISNGAETEVDSSGISNGAEAAGTSNGISNGVKAEVDSSSSSISNGTTADIDSGSSSSSSSSISNGLRTNVGSSSSSSSNIDNGATVNADSSSSSSSSSSSIHDSLAAYSNDPFPLGQDVAATAQLIAALEAALPPPEPEPESELESNTSAPASASPPAVSKGAAEPFPVEPVRMHAPKGLSAQEMLAQLREELWQIWEEEPEFVRAVYADSRSCLLKDAYQTARAKLSEATLHVATLQAKVHHLQELSTQAATRLSESRQKLQDVTARVEDVFKMKEYWKVALQNLEHRLELVVRVAVQEQLDELPVGVAPGPVDHYPSVIAAKLERDSAQLELTVLNTTIKDLLEKVRVLYTQNERESETARVAADVAGSASKALQQAIWEELEAAFEVVERQHQLERVRQEMGLTGQS